MMRFSQWPREIGWSLYYAIIENDFDKIKKEVPLYLVIHLPLLIHGAETGVLI